MSVIIPLESFKGLDASVKASIISALKAPIADEDNDLTLMSAQDLRDAWHIMRHEPMGALSGGQLFDERVLIEALIWRCRELRTTKLTPETLGQEDATGNFTTPLTACGDAEKLKELTFRFPDADFHLTKTNTGACYKITYDGSLPGYMSTGIRWYKNDDMKGFCADFPRPFKIELTTRGGVKKDVTYLFH